MKINLLKKAHHNQRGFTLIEVIVAIAIMGLLSIGIAAVTIEVIAGNARYSNKMTTARQVQQVGQWMTMDGQMAELVIAPLVPNSPEPLTVEWTEYRAWNFYPEDPDDSESPLTIHRVIKHEVVYTYNEEVIVREEYTTEEIREDEADPPYTLLSKFPVARFISWIECPYLNGTITVKVVSTISGYQGVTEQRVFEIVPRPT